MNEEIVSAEGVAGGQGRTADDVMRSANSGGWVVAIGGVLLLGLALVSTFM